MNGHGGAREGAGRPRADARGHERRKHSLYCTKDELQEARWFLQRLRADVEKQEEPPKPERYVFEIGESVASFRDWDCGAKFDTLEELIKRNSRRVVELHFVDGRRGTKDIVMTLHDVASVKEAKVMPDVWVFLDGNGRQVATLDVNEVGKLEYFFTPDSNLAVNIEAVCVDDGYDD